MDIIVVLIVVGVVLLTLAAVLVRRWDKTNRRRYPDRASDKFFEINRNKR